MLNSIDKIQDTLANCGLRIGDTIFLHGDENVITQINISENKEKNLSYFFGALIDLVGKDGTIVVPTFTYSFIKSKIFDVNNSKSEVGNFSEKFRNIDKIKRSKNPIFSVAAIGRHAKDFANSSTKSSFGKNSCFGLLNKFGAKIFCIGCSFNKITYVHHVEENLQVKYRYMKEFDGEILDNDNSILITNEYYVRDLSFDTNCNLNKLKKKMIENKEIILGDFGRLRTYLCNSNNFIMPAVKFYRKINLD